VRPELTKSRKCPCGYTFDQRNYDEWRGIIHRQLPVIFKDDPNIFNDEENVTYSGPCSPIDNDRRNGDRPFICHDIIHDDISNNNNDRRRGSCGGMRESSRSRSRGRERKRARR
jgi:hypothetical protein